MMCAAPIRSIAGTKVRLFTSLVLYTLAWLRLPGGAVGSLITSCTLTLPPECSGTPGRPSAAPKTHSSE